MHDIKRTHAKPRALIVYESMFGNTESIARVIGNAIAEDLETEVVAVADAPNHLDGVDLLVLGAPTHAFGLSRSRTREDARTKGAHAPTGLGAREWLAAVSRPALPICAAAFDTRIRRPRVPGSAARAARRRLRRLGFNTDVKAMSFYVTGTSGPLAEGERERAERWGRELSSNLVSTARSGVR